MKIYLRNIFRHFLVGILRILIFLYKEAFEHNIFKKNYFSAAFQGRIFSMGKPQLKNTVKPLQLLLEQGNSY